MWKAYCVSTTGPNRRGVVRPACDTKGVRKTLTSTALAVALAVTGVAVSGPASAAKKPSKVVYLTFDDGPNGGNDPVLLKTLRKADVKATFFLVGRSLAADPGAAKRLYVAGHAVGNHTYNHVDLTTVAAPTITHELAATQHALGAVGGACMRPPYGAVSSTVVGVAAAMGLKPVLWNVDPEDWAHQDTAYIVNHVLTHVRDRSVVLMHDGGGDRLATVRAVRQIIPALRARGYAFRTVPACRVRLKANEFGLAKTEPEPAPTVTPTPSPSPSDS